MRRAWLALLILCSTTGCDLLPTGPSGKPDVVGVVRALELREIAQSSVPTIMVEVRQVRSSARVLKGCGGVSQFHLYESTRINWASGGVAAPDDIEPGRRVSIWIVAGSPITLSCTPGAAAARVRLE
ncbi:MAG TPA: hypothetical protein VHG52_06220 [Thermomicrobiales bacterium]|nr:hypothetical protein [Thermomicrobiales bacterium]